MQLHVDISICVEKAKMSIGQWRNRYFICGDLAILRCGVGGSKKSLRWSTHSHTCPLLQVLRICRALTSST